MRTHTFARKRIKIFSLEIFKIFQFILPFSPTIVYILIKSNPRCLFPNKMHLTIKICPRCYYGAGNPIQFQEEASTQFRLTLLSFQDSVCTKKKGQNLFPNPSSVLLSVYTSQEVKTWFISCSIYIHPYFWCSQKTCWISFSRDTFTGYSFKRQIGGSILSVWSELRACIDF